MILTAFFFGPFPPELSSSAGPSPIAVRRDGRGGGIAPAGFGSGFWSSLFMCLLVRDAGLRRAVPMTTEMEQYGHHGVLWSDRVS
jgi:hypothetical protein